MNTDTPPTDNAPTDMQRGIIRDLERKVQGWKDKAADSNSTRETYHGWLTEIGRLLGPDAYLADDGSYQDHILVAKVPELVTKHMGLMRRLDLGIYYLGRLLGMKEGSRVEQVIAATVGHMNQQAREITQLQNDKERLTDDLKEQEARVKGQVARRGEDILSFQQETTMLKATLQTSQEEKARLEQTIADLRKENDLLFKRLPADVQTGPEDKARLEQTIMDLRMENAWLLKRLPVDQHSGPVDMDELALLRATWASTNLIGKPKPGVEFLPGGLVGPLTVASDTPPEPALDWSKNLATLPDTEIDKP